MSSCPCKRVLRAMSQQTTSRPATLSSEYGTCDSLGQILALP